MMKTITLLVVLLAAGCWLPSAVRAQGTPGTVRCPSQVDTLDTLFRVTDSARTILSSNLTSSSSSVTVSSTGSFPSSGSIKIDSEIIYYGSKTSLTFTALVRGASGTVSAAHSLNAQVTSPILAAHHNTLAQAVICAEQKTFDAMPLSYLDTDTLLAANSNAKVPSQHAVKSYVDSGLSGKVPLSYIDTDGTMAANSDVKIPSQKAAKTYVDTGLAGKVPLSYIDTDGTMAANSDAKIPSQKAAKTYVDTGLAGKVPTTRTVNGHALSADVTVTPTDLGLVIGTNVEAYDSDLLAIAAIAPANDDIIQRKSGAWINRTPAQLKTDLAIAESDLSFTDITTNNASTLKHGFLKKLSGVTTDYLAGDGNWTTLPGGTAAANPTALVGLSAVNGSAATYMRSDAAPPLSQSIAPTWTGQHNFGAALLFSATLSPTALSGDVNDYNPTNLSTSLALRIDGGAADRNITGLAGGADGRILTVTNIGASNNLVLKNQSSSSSAGNRFLLPGNDVTLPIDTAIALRYDGTTSRWRPWSRALANTGVAAGTYMKVTVDVTGRVTAATTAACADLSNASAFCSGTDAANLTGTIATARMNPSVSAHTFLGNNSGSSAAASFAQPACGDLSNASAFCSGTDAANLTGTIATARMNPSVSAHTFLGNNSGSSAAASFAQPACGDLSNASAFCSGTDAANLTGTIATARMNPSVSAHTFLGNNTGSSAAAAFAQPACGDLSNASAFCSGTDAANLTGTVAAARMNPSVSAHTFLGNNSGSSAAASFGQPACGDLSNASAFCSGTDAVNLTGTVAAARMNPSVSAHTFLGNNTGSSAAASFAQLACGDLSNAGNGCSGTLPVGANPSASIGLSAVNGSASSFMRSDAAPPIDQTIVPTWTGLHTFKYSDAATNAFTDVLTIGHNSSGTPAANFGGSILFNLKSSTTADRNAARIGPLWTTATDGSRTSAVDVQLVNSAAALASVARFFASGGLALNSTSDPGPALSVTNNGIAATSTDGLVLQNTTTATSGVPLQYSPRIRFVSSEYTSGPGASAVEFIQELIPESETYGGIAWSYRTGGSGAYTRAMKIDAGGGLRVGNAAGFGDGYVNAAGGYYVNGHAFNYTDLAGAAPLPTLDGAIAHNSANISCTSGTNCALTFDTNDKNVSSVHSTSSNTSRFTFSSAGWVGGQCTIQSGLNSSSATGLLRIMKNATTFVADLHIGASTNANYTVNFLDFASANDYYECIVYSGDGNYTVTATSGYPFMKAARVGQ